MKSRILLNVIAIVSSICLSGAGAGGTQEAATAKAKVSARRIPHFTVTDASVSDSLSRLTKSIDDLHLGFEEVPRQRTSDEADKTNRFSMDLSNVTISFVLDAICAKDPRYRWSEDGQTINVYPSSSADDKEYLPNISINEIVLDQVPDPYQALTPLARLLPEKQIGYIGTGQASYAEQWSAHFSDVTVRQFANRISEHLGPRSTWIYQGSKREMLFTFFAGSFN